MGIAERMAYSLSGIESEENFYISVPHGRIMKVMFGVTLITFVYYLISVNFLVAMVTFPVFLTAAFIYYGLIRLCIKFKYRVLMMLLVIALFNAAAVTAAVVIRNYLLSLI